MSPPTIHTVKEVPHRMGHIDEAALAAKREERFRARQARIMADPTLPDAVKEAYLDRTICDTRTSAQVLGANTHRVSELRRGADPLLNLNPHPLILPPMDTVECYNYGHPSPGVELGRLLEWAVQRGTHTLVDPAGRTLAKRQWRGGRPRAERLTVGKVHTRGTARKQAPRTGRRTNPLL